MITWSTELVLEYGKRLARSLVRRGAPVQVNDLASTAPVSRKLGHDRGLPIDRHYIEQFLREHSGDIRGRVLEIGSSRYVRAFGRSVSASDVLHATADNDAATIVGDLTRHKTLPHAAYDCFICTQTLNFIYDVAAAVDGIAHVLRPGGVVLATVSGISQISRYDMERWGDYWRFTDASLRRLFEPAFGDAIEIHTYGNVAAAMAFLQGLAVEDLPDRDVLDHRDPDYQVTLAVRARKK